jgi:serine/threonine-protein kinase
MSEADPVRLEAEARIGLVLKSKWRLDSLIGVGGMAAVYAATHRNAKRVAVKMLHSDVSSDAHVRERFVREGYAANRVGHPGAVDILDDDVTEDGSAFLVMELLDGENLDRRMRRKGGRLTAAEVLSVADQVLDTLAAAHARGVLHRDIKPENVFLTRDGVVKLLDFGIARVFELTRASKVTQRGAVLGTPAFMPPEQAMAIWEEVDPRSDIWAVGATLFMLLTGQFVHQAASGMEALDFAVSKRARSVGAVRSGLHPSVVHVVDRALAYEKAARYQSAREMQEAVRAAYAELEGQARMQQLSLPGEDEDDFQSDSLSTAPAPDYPADEPPVSAAANTIISKRKSKTRTARSVVAFVAGTVVVVVAAAVLGRGRGPSLSPSSLPPGEGTANVKATAAPPPAPIPTVTSPPRIVPVLPVSALPPEPSAAPSSGIARSVRLDAPPGSRSRSSTSVTERPTPAPEPSAAPATQAKPADEADPFSGRF